jgi:hypothetical protein
VDLETGLMVHSRVQCGYACTCVDEMMKYCRVSGAWKTGGPEERKAECPHLKAVYRFYLVAS